MPWKEASVVSLRREFVGLAINGSNIAQLSQYFGVSRTTAYKWLERYSLEGESGLSDRSRRPLQSPRRTDKSIEEAIKAVRRKHPAWGGRKIKRYLENGGCRHIPAASTITQILRRIGLINPEDSVKHAAQIRFQRSEANDLWQMDFKGHIRCPEGRCHPLTVLDDYSRYAVTLKACLNERGETVQACLKETFRRYGLPNQMVMDNGSPWGFDLGNPYTYLTVWLIRIGVLISHSRPAHPQTLGKDERFHRTLKAELLGNSIPWKNEESQKRFDRWRFMYNHRRPHEALDMNVPASRYVVSKRPYREELESIEYGPGDIVRKVQQNGILHFKGREFRLPKAFIGFPIALRPRDQSDGIFDAYFIRQPIAVINLNHD